MELLTIVLAAVIASAAAVLVMRLWPTGGGAAGDKAAVERQLAIAETTLTEIRTRLREAEEARDGLRVSLDAQRDANGRLEQAAAANGETIRGIDAASADLRDRLAASDQRAVEISQNLDATRREKGDLEQAAAAGTEAVRGLEATCTELRQRLAEAEQRWRETSEHLDTARREKADLESGNAEKSTLLVEKNDAISKLNIQADQQRLALETAHRDVSNLRVQIAAMKTAQEEAQRSSEEKLKLLIETKERMTQEFRLLADGLMQSHGETFTKQNKEQIDTVLGPLREKLTEFQQGLHEARVETTKERATLVEQIRQLSESSAKVTSEANNLARALRGEAQTQGAWGEMILASILEKSGLRKGEEYVDQQSMASDDGQRLRPDVLVNLPGGQTIVIDSKVSLSGFDAYVNAVDDLERAAALTRHLTSMRNHIRSLSGKEYHSVAGSHVDYVIMFVPIEGALAAGLTADPSLTAFAVENNVAIATPTTLMIALRTVNNVWQVERRNRNAEQIAMRAGLLYDKLVGFVGDMNGLGTTLDRARKSFGDAMGKLSTGGGNLIRQAEQLKELGARTRRSLPVSLTGDDKADAAGDVVVEEANEVRELAADE